MKNKIYFRSIVRRWKKEACEAEYGLVIVSPYITSSTAKTILDSTQKINESEVFTDFSLLNFINGSSSLHALKYLHRKGFKLYHLPHVHAKVFLSKNKFASIGSQNITSMGNLNREASTCYIQKDELIYIENCLASWKLHGTPITIDMINDYINVIQPLKIEYKELIKSIKSTENGLKNIQIEREAKLNSEIIKTIEDQLNKERKDRIEKLNKAIYAVPRTHFFRKCRVEKIYSPTSSTYSLISPERKDLTKWHILKVGDIYLESLQRYLCINTATGALGWARVGKTRITFVNNGLSLNKSINISSIPCDLILKCILDHKNNSNISIEIKMGNVKSLLKGWFGVDSLIIDMNYETNNRIDGWIKEHSCEVIESIIPKIISPFTYKKSLVGGEADTFFGPVGSYFYLNIIQLSGFPILVCEPS